MMVSATRRRSGETLEVFADRMRRQYADLAKAVGYSVDERGDVRVEHRAVLRAAERAHPMRYFAAIQRARSQGYDEGYDEGYDAREPEYILE